MRFGQWRSGGKGKREDAWRGAREALGDKVSEKNKVACKWVREFLEKVTTSVFQ